MNSPQFTKSTIWPGALVPGEYYWALYKFDEERRREIVKIHRVAEGDKSSLFVLRFGYGSVGFNPENFDFFGRVGTE